MSEITFNEAAELLPMYGNDLHVEVYAGNDSAMRARGSRASCHVFDSEDEGSVLCVRSYTWSCKISSAEVKRCVLEEGRLTFDCGDHRYEVEQA